MLSHPVPSWDTGSQLTMEGRIKAGAWMPFEAEWQGDGRSFEWRARAGRPFRPLRVVDHYAKGDGGMDVRLFGIGGLGESPKSSSR
jgi:hypothetical protein